MHYSDDISPQIQQSDDLDSPLQMPAHLPTSGVARKYINHQVSVKKYNSVARYTMATTQSQNWL